MYPTLGSIKSLLLYVIRNAFDHAAVGDCTVSEAPKCLQCVLRIVSIDDFDSFTNLR